MTGFGEVLPYEDNRFTLDYEKLDQWGLPTVTFDAEFKENEWNMESCHISVIDVEPNKDGIIQALNNSQW